jgi:hypothetical protein
LSDDETGATSDASTTIGTHMRFEYGLSAFYANAYLLQAAQSLWHASVAEKATFPLPEHAMTATVFTGLAGEAYINTAMDLLLGPENTGALQGPLPERWITGPRLALGHTVFDKGAEPHATLVLLSRERNRLVHARSFREGWEDGKALERTHQDLATVARYILRLSQAVDTLGAEAQELEELRLVPRALLRIDVQLSRYDARRHADDLRIVVRQLRVQLAQEEFGTLREWVEDYGEDAADAWWTDETTVEEDLPEP